MICVYLMKKQPTYLHPPTGNYSVIDLSLCHPSIYLDFDWSVCDDLHGSDHFPNLMKLNHLMMNRIVDGI